MRSAVFAAAWRYLAGIFALGFVLGTLRTLWLAPLVGPVVAVTCELPLILAASWYWARRLLARHRLAGRGQALAMGAIAFALLMVGELVLGMALGGQSGAQWFAALAEPAGTLGLSGQIGFALIPALIWRPDPRFGCR